MNSLEGVVEQHVKEHLAVICDLLESSDFKHSMEQALASLTRCFSSGGVIYFCGNGGSAADSQHLAAELVGRFGLERGPLRAVALSTDTSVLTCIANDYSFEDIFARQVEGLIRKGDVLMAISTSGNSQNVIRAADSAKARGAVVIGFLGGSGGELQRHCDTFFIVPSTSTARIQECHIFIGHVICDLIDRELMPSASLP